MSERKFWRISRFICKSFFQITWFLIIFTFVIIPRMIILAFRRVHIKNKMQRKLRKNGLPKKLAKIQAKHYKNILADFGSIKGLWKITRDIRKKPDDKSEELVNNKIDTKIIDHTNKNSSIS
ncbi:MAG: hypothetical protein FK730_04325 [Asgard group archaeon]|nr:hypothetical protein [Asgard group archaeon]